MSIHQHGETKQIELNTGLSTLGSATAKQIWSFSPAKVSAQDTATIVNTTYLQITKALTQGTWLFRTYLEYSGGIKLKGKLHKVEVQADDLAP